MSTIHNPILPGFNPDPSILRVGDDYYIATSTFEWFPGVQIHHSRDLVHWRLLTRPLDRLRQLDLRGCPHSGGVWAPCLSHDGERFYLIYTNTRHWGSGWWESPNYLVHATDVTGPWSDPVFLNCSGFDPSLFHDDGGRKWLLNMRWDGRPGQPRFSGIELQEYDPAAERLVGDVHLIWTGTERGITEGPHVYRRDGWYYLLCAEGGTGHGHCVSVARSRELTGPYEVHPDNPILHAPRDEDHALAKTGHGSFVQAGDGSWWLAHLCGRPIPSFLPGDEMEGNRYCPLGRETALQRLEWPAGEWPQPIAGEGRPRREWPAPTLPAQPWPEPPAERRFDGELPLEFQSLREPITADWCDLQSRPGWLRLRGRASLDANVGHSLLARRIEHVAFHASTRLELDPRDWKQKAGLVAYYDRTAYRMLTLTADDDGQRILVLETVDHRAGIHVHRDDEVVSLPETGAVDLGLTSDGEGRMRFAWRLAGDAEWRSIGAEHALSRLSDEHASEGQFTGAFVGIASVDHRDHSGHADFEIFTYRAL